MAGQAETLGYSVLWHRGTVQDWGSREEGPNELDLGERLVKWTTVQYAVVQ